MIVFLRFLYFGNVDDGFFEIIIMSTGLFLNVFCLCGIYMRVI